MEWLWGAAFVPLLLCGLMCGIPMLLAVVGFRRGSQRDSSGCHGGSGEARTHEPVEETSTKARGRVKASSWPSEEPTPRVIATRLSGRELVRQREKTSE